jgi:hypothetical protein
MVNSLRCNIASKARGRHYTTSRGKPLCITARLGARHPEWAIFTLRPSKHEPTLVRCSFDSSRHRADRHSHLVPKGE